MGVAVFGRGWIRAVALAAAFVLLSSMPPAALAKSRRPHVDLLSLSFSRIGPGFGALVADGDYAFIGAEQSGSVGTLINDRTGTATPVEQPTCASGGTNGTAPGGGWLALECLTPAYPAGGLTELFDIASGAWRTLNYPLAASCDCGLELTAVGGDWVELTLSGSGCHYVCISSVFQNIDTGTVEGDPTDTHTIPNLSAASLSQPVCAPLQVPQIPPDEDEGSWGSLEPDGSFVIAADPFGTYLERCGSRLHEPIAANANGIAMHTGLIAWWGYSMAHPDSIGQLNGIALPSRRLVRIPLPRSLQLSDGMTLALSSRRFYVDVIDGLYAARLPTKR